MKKIIILLVISLFVIGCLDQEKPEEVSGGNGEVNVPPTDQKEPVYETTLEVRRKPDLPNGGIREGELTHVMIHFISNVIANRNNPFIIEEVYGILNRYGLSVHYIIDREGNIYKTLPETHTAFHAGRGVIENFPHLTNRFNHYSIGIELMAIGTESEMADFLTPAQYRALNPEHIGFTDAQMTTLNKLINDIIDRHPTINPTREFIIGHSEYSPDKPDPGALFDWTRLDFTRNN